MIGQTRDGDVVTIELQRPDHREHDHRDAENDAGDDPGAQCRRLVDLVEVIGAAG